MTPPAPPYTSSQVSGGLVYFVMQTVDSCVATLFVCFVEDPAALSVHVVASPGSHGAPEVGGLTVHSFIK